MKYQNLIIALFALTLLSFTSCKKDDDEEPINTPNPIILVIESTFPENSATGVARNKTVWVEFNLEMNPSSINENTFTIKQGATVVQGTISYASKRATFTPTNYFEANKVYTANVTKDISGVNGNAIASNASWNFTT